MGEKIIISFDDEKPEKEEKPEEKIIIDFESKPKDKSTEKVKTQKINSFYKGNPHLTGFENSELKYPEGLENGFRKIFSSKLNDVFFNSVLLNNNFVALSSASGNIYFIDRFSGEMFSKIVLTNESFEKTGIVIDNNIYVNSVKSIFGFEFQNDEVKEKRLYTIPNDFYLWSNLNRWNKKIIFLEYSPTKKIANYSSLEITESNRVKKSGEFSVSHFLYDSVIVFGENAFIFYDDKILKYGINSNERKEYNLNFIIDSDTNFLLLDGKIYFNNKNNELFYFDIENEGVRFTGIKCPYINSLGGFGDNIFIGTLNGWYLYKSTGVLLFSYEDVNGNKIESVNKNILTVSSENKIIFHNLNKFQEAEGFAITQDTFDTDTDKIVSAKIGDDVIFALTKSGILEAFNNDKLNLFI